MRSTALFLTSMYELTVYQFVVEVCSCQLMVRLYEQNTYTKANKTNDVPTDEGKVQQEQSHFVTLHKSLRLVKTLFCTQFGLVEADVIGCKICIFLYDARDDQ